MLEGHEDFDHARRIQPDGSRVVTASADGTARLWDASSGAVLTVLWGHGARMTHAAFSPDGTRVVTTSHDATARLWDASGGETLAVLKGHENWLDHAAFSPDGTRV